MRKIENINAAVNSHLTNYTNKDFTKEYEKLNNQFIHEHHEKEVLQQRLDYTNQQLELIEKSFTVWSNEFITKLSLQDARQWLLEKKIVDEELQKTIDKFISDEKHRFSLFRQKAVDIALYKKFLNHTDVEVLFFDPQFHEMLRHIHYETGDIFKLGTSLNFNNIVKINMSLFKYKIVVPLILKFIEEIKNKNMMFGELRVRTNNYAEFREKYNTKINFPDVRNEDLLIVFYFQPRLEKKEINFLHTDFRGLFQGTFYFDPNNSENNKEDETIIYLSLPVYKPEKNGLII